MLENKNLNGKLIQIWKQLKLIDWKKNQNVMVLKNKLVNLERKMFKLERNWKNIKDNILILNLKRKWKNKNLLLNHQHKLKNKVINLPKMIKIKRRKINNSLLPKRFLNQRFRKKNLHQLFNNKLSLEKIKKEETKNNKVNHLSISHHLHQQKSIKFNKNQYRH